MMDFDAWSVDLESGSAVHATGFKIIVEGDPANPMGVNPGRFPEGLSAVQQATLLRCGLEHLMQAAQNSSYSHSRKRFAAAAAPVEAKVVKERKTPTRPVLSLKRKG